jgi:hypothetical protein
MTSTPSNISLVRKFFPKQVNHINTSEDWIMVGVLLLGTLFLLVGVVFPLYSMIIRSLQDGDGQWI